MTRTRFISATGLCVLLIGGAASAAPRTPVAVCRQMQDPAGDAQPLGPNNKTGLPQVAALDVISADFATTSKLVLAQIRLKSLAPDPATALGSAYKFSWTVNGVAQSLMYRTFADGAPDAVFDADTTTGTIQDLVPATFAVNASTSTITLSLPRKSDGALRLVGNSTKFTKLEVQTYGGVGRQNGSSMTGFDIASQAKAYVDRTPTCIKGT